MIEKIVCRYLMLRHKGVYAPKPPLGFSPFSPRPSWKRRIRFWVFLQLWRSENWLYDAYGKPIRDRWLAEFHPQALEKS